MATLSVEQIELLHTLRGLTNEGISNIPENAVRRAVRRLDYPDAPRARFAFRVAQSRDDQGQIPPQPLVKALRERDGLSLRTEVRAVAGVPAGGRVRPAFLSPIQTSSLAVVPPALAGLQTRKWSALGPGNVGGRTRAIVVHPNQPNTMWVGSVGGGIWRTDDGGQIWLPVDDFMANLAVTCLVMDPTNFSVMYAGTGEGFGNLDAIRGGGIFHTSDGSTWSQLPSTTGEIWNSINRLAIAADGSVLLAATNAGIKRSADPDRANWLTVLPDSVADVKFHPSDPRLAVAGSLASGAVWITSDGGASWSRANHEGTWGGRVEICYAPANPTTIYASVEAEHGQIWRSTDGGRTFAQRGSKNADGAPANYLGDQGWYGNAIWAGDPTNANLVVVGGIDLWRSVDGGDSLIDISTWWDPRSAHADHHAIVSHPQYDGVNNRTVFFGNDGGLCKADDITSVGNDAAPPRVAGWLKLNNSYGVTQFYSAAANSATGVIVGGAQDNGTLAYRPTAGAQNWQEIFGGDGGFCCADPTDAMIFYGEYVYLNIHRSTDGATSDDTAGDRYITGQFWNAAAQTWDWKPLPYKIPDAQNQQALFIAPFILDPNNSSRILAGGVSLWRTNDAKTANAPTSGPRWSRIKPPANGNISAIAITPGNSDLVWVGYDDQSGEVWRSVNATSTSPTWSLITGQGPNALTPRRYCNRIFVSPHDPNTVLVAFGGFTAGNVWRTLDGGANWSNIGAGLPPAPVRAITIHPQNASWYYIGTELGMFASENSGLTWSPTNEGPANVSVDDLSWMQLRLVCVTHGRGIFEIDLSPAGVAALGGGPNAISAAQLPPQKSAAAKRGPRSVKVPKTRRLGRGQST